MKFTIPILTALLLLAAPAAAHSVFEVHLGTCTVDVCGEDSTAVLEDGRVEVDEDGEVEVEIEGLNLPNALLTVCFESVSGADPEFIGQVLTDDSGDVDEEAGVFAARSAAGIFVLTDGDETCANGNRLLATSFSTEASSTAPGVPGDDEDSDSDSDSDGFGRHDDDNDNDGISNDDDSDDDNDGIDDLVDADDDGDGIPDGEDADPSDANRFDDEDRHGLKAAFKAEMRELKAKAKAAKATLKGELRDEKRALKGDLRDRRDDFD